MINCDIAKNHFKELDRMCNSMQHCKDCMIQYVKGENCSEKIRLHPTAVQYTVSIWSDKHPMAYGDDEEYADRPSYAPCSETTQCLNELKRLCDSKPHCEDCPIQALTEHNCHTIIVHRPDQMPTIIQKWSDENPPTQPVQV